MWNNLLPLINTPIFCLFFTFLVYYGYLKLASFIKNPYIQPFCNPILLTALTIIGVFLVLDIDIMVYEKNVQMINFLLPLATILMSVNVYRNRQIFKKYFIVIFLAVGVGSFFAVIFVPLLAVKIFHLDTIFIVPSYLKTITSAFALEIANQVDPSLGALTLVGIMISGITGAILLPIILRVFKIQDDHIAWGVAIGTTSHVVGTVKALEINKEAGSIASVALALSGLWVLIFFQIFR